MEAAAEFYQERFDDAKRLIRRSLELDPTSGNTRFVLAAMYQRTGEIEKARIEAERLVRENPGDQAAAQLLGIINSRPPPP